MTAQLDNPLFYLGSLDARYYTVQLHGVVPVSPSTADRLSLRAPLEDVSPSDPSAPARLSAPYCTLSATASLTPVQRHPRSRTDTSTHLPYLPRNALLLSNINTLHNWPAAARHTASPTPDTSSASGPTPISQYAANTTTSPLLQYPVLADQVEFFPLSSLRIPHTAPTDTPLNLTQWFMAECLASSVTYTSLLTTPPPPSAPTAPWQLNQAALDAGISADTKLHTYAALNKHARRFWFGGDCHTALIESTLRPPASDTYSAHTQHLTPADVVTAAQDGTSSLPPTETWFKLTASIAPPTPRDVGALGETRTHLVMEIYPTVFPAHYYARWVSYTLASPTIRTTSFDAPYFSPTSCLDAIHYSRMTQAKERDTVIENTDEQAQLDTGHALAHSLPHITRTALFREAHAYALTLSQQRQHLLTAQAKASPATVVYSDKLCFTRSGAYNSRGNDTPLLTRVARIDTFSDSTPSECVVTEEQYISLHQLASRHVRDQTRFGPTLAEMDSTPDEQLPTMKFLSTHSSRKNPPRRRRTKQQIQAGAAGLDTNDHTSLAPPRGRGRPQGARNRLTQPRFIEGFKAVGVLADSVLRVAAEAYFSGFKKKIMDIHNPTSDWTRLTPLMPPASHTSVAQARYGRGLPIRAVNNQHIDSLLWRSLLNRWLNDPRYERIKMNRPPILQITKLMDPLDASSSDPIPYHHDTQFAYATLFVPVPASVMHQWLTSGPTQEEIAAIQPLTTEHDTPDTDTPKRKGYYDDPRITTEEKETISGAKYDITRHERLPDYPEIFSSYSVSTKPANEVVTAILLQPGPDVSPMIPPDKIPEAINLTPRTRN